MKRRILSVILVVALLIPMVMGIVPVTTHADASMPSIAAYLNGSWVAAQTLEAGSGESWLTLPLPGNLLVNSRENYVRITSNVANGTTDDTQVKLYFSNSTWSNSFLSEQIWVDDNWSAYSNEQANCYIEGWDGSQWKRIHADDSYSADSGKVLGKNSGGNYTSYARNIWVDANVVENYTAFRLKCHVYVGSNLTVNAENANLFPAANYLSCDLCESCGGCKSGSCTLSHAACSCDGKEAIRIRVAGNWYGLYITEEMLGQDKLWVSVPVDMNSVTAGAMCQMTVSSNVVNSGNLDGTSIDLYATSAAEGLESFLTNDRYSDGGWAQYTDRNINVKLEGWDGHAWVDLSASQPAYSADSTTVAGLFGGNSTWYNACRNVTVRSDLSGITAMRASVQLHIGENVQAAEGYVESDFATFLPEQTVTEHTMCAQHTESCGVEGCAYNTCAGLHHCTFCAICGLCKCADCGCEHEKCQQHEAVRVRFNNQWYGLYLTQNMIGKDQQWISVPVDMTGIIGGTLCPVSVSSNIASGGNLDGTSIDLYATAATEGLESFLTNDRYCDSGWMGYSDRNVNVKIEGWDGHEWVDLSAAKPTYGADGGTTVLGLFKSNDTWYNAARNITLVEDMSNITAMRVSLQVHVGEAVTTAEGFVESEFAAFPPEQTVTEHAMCSQHTDSCTAEGCPYNTCAQAHHCTLCESCGLCICTDDCGCEHEKCTISEDAALRVRVNTQWYGLALADAARTEGAQWVYVPVDITKLNQNATNYIHLSSNLENAENLGRHSVDVYFTAGEALSGSFLTNERYCDTGWAGYSDRQINMMLQFFDGTQWVSAVEEVYAQDHSSVVGLYGPDDTWYNYARNIDLTDLTGYSAARVAVQVQVGGGANVVSDYTADGFAAFLSTDLTQTPPVSQETDTVVVHTTQPKTPAAGESAGGDEAVLQLRINGNWYEKSLKNVVPGGQGQAWVNVEFPASELNSQGFNQVVLSSNVKNGTAYSANTLDLFATRVENTDSFRNVNAYYDEWSPYTDYQWNMYLEVSQDGSNWVSLNGTAPAYYDAAVPMGQTADGSGSYAAKNFTIGDVSGYAYARVRVQLHIGNRLTTTGDAQHNTTPLSVSAGDNGVSSAHEPVLQVRVNGQWFEASLADQLGTNGKWTYVPVALENLNGNAENYFSVSTNVVNHGNMNGNSVEVYASRVIGGTSFKTTDQFCDQNFALWENYDLNMRIEGFDGSKWVLIAGTADAYYDEAVTLGYQANTKTWQNVARNIVLGDLSGYQAARVAVMTHVGSHLDAAESAVNAGQASISHNSEPPKEAEGKEVTDSQDAALRVRVNGTWFETALQEYKGTGSVWVPVDIDLSLLSADAENYFSISSNVSNYGSFSGNTVDIFCTLSNQVNSFTTADQYCDNGYALFADRNVNMRLEAFDGEKWVVIAPVEDTYYDGTVVLGYDADNSQWSSVARNLVIGSLDGYTHARVMVQVHVGGALETVAFQSAGGNLPAGSREDDFNRDVDVTMPTHADEAVEDGGQNPNNGWLWIVLLAVLLCALALVVILLWKKKGNKKKV